MTNESIHAMMAEVIAHLRSLALENPATPMFVAGYVRLDDGSDQYRIYEVDLETSPAPHSPKKGQRICFVGKGLEAEPKWLVALFQFDTYNDLEDSMRIDLPLVGTTAYLALRIFDYIVNGNFLRDPEPPKFIQ